MAKAVADALSRLFIPATGPECTVQLEDSNAWNKPKTFFDTMMLEPNG